jgi:hypothetical protein
VFPDAAHVGDLGLMGAADRAIRGEDPRDIDRFIRGETPLHIVATT